MQCPWKGSPGNHPEGARATPPRRLASRPGGRPAAPGRKPCTGSVSSLRPSGRSIGGRPSKSASSSCHSLIGGVFAFAAEGLRRPGGGGHPPRPNGLNAAPFPARAVCVRRASPLKRPDLTHSILRGFQVLRCGLPDKRSGPYASTGVFVIGLYLEIIL